MTSDTFDNVCVHLSHDLQTHLTVCCPSHDLNTSDSLSSSISWPADTFDSVCVHPSYDMQTLLTVFVFIHLMSCRHFRQWFYVHPSHDIQTLFKVGLTGTYNTTFSFSIFYKLFPGYNLYWCHYFVFQTPWQRHTLHVWYLNLTMQERAAEHSWMTNSTRQLQTKEQEINRLPKLTLCGWQDTKILLTECHNFVLAQFKLEKACTYCNIKWLYM